MKKGILIIALIVSLLICFLPSCSDRLELIDGSTENSTKASEEIFNSSCTENTTSSTTIESERLYPDAYASVTEGKAKAEIPKLDWNSIIASIPATYYEEYPGLHGKPLSAVLYKNGERTELSLDDERLVRLWNFYNNIVYNCRYAYTQGSYNTESELYKNKENAEFRLELTFEQAPNSENLEHSFDKVVVVGGKSSCFIGIISNMPFSSYPYSAFGRYPLYATDPGIVDWLVLFGF